MTLKYVAKNTALIQHKWKNDASQLIQVYNNSLETKMNYITEIVDVNMDEEKFGAKLNKGDTIFLSRYIIVCKKFNLDKGYVSSYPYSSIPAKYIVGRFKDGMLNLGSLEMFMDKILVEPIDEYKIGSIYLPQGSKCNVGIVKKVGTHSYFNDLEKKPLAVKENDVVIFWNNSSTPLKLAGRPYEAIGEDRILGRFKDNIIEMENLELLDGQILLRDLPEEKVDLKSSLIFIDKNNEFEDLSTQENNYEVFKISSKGKEVRKGVHLDNHDIKEGDILMINRDIAQFVYFKGKQYYLVPDIGSVDAVLR